MEAHYREIDIDERSRPHHGAAGEKFPPYKSTQPQPVGLYRSEQGFQSRFFAFSKDFNPAQIVSGE